MHIECQILHILKGSKVQFQHPMQIIYNLMDCYYLKWIGQSLLSSQPKAGLITNFAMKLEEKAVLKYRLSLWDEENENLKLSSDPQSSKRRQR